MIERDVIGHLMDVEHQASDFVAEAMKEADRRKALARESAERVFMDAYGPLVRDLESWLDDGKKACIARRDADYAAYSAHLSSLARDSRTFDAFLDSVLAES